MLSPCRESTFKNLKDKGFNKISCSGVTVEVMQPIDFWAKLERIG